MAGRSSQKRAPSRPRRNTYEINDVKFAALGRWIDIFTNPSLGGIDDSFLSGQHGPCPKCGGNDRWRLIDEREGAAICNQCLPTKGGDGFGVLGHLRDWDFPTTLTAVAEYLLVPPSTVARTTARSRSGSGAGARGTKRGSRKHRVNADPAEHLVFKDPPGLSAGYVSLFRRAKPPINQDALLACGAKQASYRGRHTVFALPIYGVELTSAPPVGWAMYESTGGTLPVFKDKKIIDQVKVKLTYGTQEGLLGPDIGRLAQITSDLTSQVKGENSSGQTEPGSTCRICWWKTEGPSDAMALWTILSEEDRKTNAVITNSNGAGQRLGADLAHLLAVSGGPVVIIHDADRPGLFGARRQAAEIADAMTALYAEKNGYSVEKGNADHYKPFVYVVQLPYELRADHGKDLRDWINEGHSLANLQALIKPGDVPGAIGSAERATAPAIARWEAEEKAWKESQGIAGKGNGIAQRPAIANNAADNGAARRSAALDGAAPAVGAGADPTARVNETSPGDWTSDPTLQPTTTDNPPPVPLEADDDPHRLARLFLDQANAAQRTIRYWRQSWYRWDGRAYREVPIDLIRGVLIRAIKAEFDRINLEKLEAARASGDSDEPDYAQKVTIQLTANVLAVLSSYVALGPQVDLNRWVDVETGAASTRPLISVENGLLDVESLLASTNDTPLSEFLVPHSPQWFSTSFLPYKFVPDAACPRWEAFISWAMDNDSERIALLQEWAGYLLLPDNSFQKFLVLEGDGANGKSAFCAAIAALLGTDNVSHVPLEMFGDRFSLFKTIGKLANIIGDVGELEKTEEGFLKSFTSGDRMTFDRKHMPSVDAIPTARLMLSANNRPRFSDRSSGLWRRMIVVPFMAKVAEEQKVRGMDSPAFWLNSGELPGILNWALIGLDRLRTKNRFTVSQVASAALAEYQLDANPAASFLDEFYEEDSEQFVIAKDTYATYKKWCYDNGFHPMSSRNFGKEVKRRFHKSENRQRGGRNDRFWVYTGIRSVAAF